MKGRLGHRTLVERHRNAPTFDLIVEPHFSVSPSRMAVSLTPCDGRGRLCFVTNDDYGLIDGIYFAAGGDLSNLLSAIPEPSTVVLLWLGLGLVAWRRRRRV